MDILQMSVPKFLLLSIVLAIVLIYLPFTVVGYARFQLGYDASAPRAMFDRLPAYAQRANWAHQNSFEAFMPYSVAALTAYVTEQTSMICAWAAIAFLFARLFYSVFYILNVPAARSLMFGIGNLAIITLFVQAIGSLK